MDMTLELLDKFIKEEAVDPSRVYVTGNSMGGYGTWEAIRRRPELFAAAVPMCGGGNLLSDEGVAPPPPGKRYPLFQRCAPANLKPNSTGVGGRPRGFMQQAP